MPHKILFEIGQIVFLKTDDDQTERMVTGINLRPNNSVTYGLAISSQESWHYDIEISDEKDMVKKTI